MFHPRIAGILMGIVLNLYVNLGGIDMLTIPIHECSIFPFIQIVFDFFISVVQFSTYKSYISISFFFFSNYKQVVFLTQVSICSLLEYRSRVDFLYVNLISCDLVELTNWFQEFFWRFFQIFMSFPNRDIFISFFLIDLYHESLWALKKRIRIE